MLLTPILCELISSCVGPVHLGKFWAGCVEVSVTDEWPLSMQLITLKERHNMNENEEGQLIFALVEMREPTALFIHQ